LSRQAFHLIGAAGCTYLRKGKERVRNGENMNKKRKRKTDKEMTEEMAQGKDEQYERIHRTRKRNI
jgi:hypothetical protein